MALPASGYLGDPARTTAEFQTAIEALRDEVALSASTTVTGRVELATDAETQTGTDAIRAVTPAGMRACTATETRIGVVELATNAEVQTGTDTARAVTPAGLRACTATETRQGVVELATNAEAITGTDTARAVTPAGLSAAIRPTTVSGHVRAGNTQIYDGSATPPSGSLSLQIENNLAEDTWVTVGPTGSGATFIWDILDNLPSTARVLIANLDLDLGSENATADQYVSVHAAAGGVTASYTNSTLIGSLGFDDFAVSAESRTFAQQFIPLSSSRIFQCRWTSNVTTDLDIVLRYKGFITD